MNTTGVCANIIYDNTFIMKPLQWEVDYYGDYVSFSNLLGETLTEISVNEDKTEILFISKNQAWAMFHDQNCCESVEIDDIVGDLEDLIGSPILMAEEAISRMSHDAKKEEDSFTWTFYKLATVKGYVTIKWFGTSNGYYSESVDFRIAKLKE